MPPGVEFTRRIQASIPSLVVTSKPCSMPAERRDFAIPKLAGFESAASSCRIVFQPSTARQASAWGRSISPLEEEIERLDGEDEILGLLGLEHHLTRDDVQKDVLQRRGVEVRDRCLVVAIREMRDEIGVFGRVHVRGLGGGEEALVELCVERLATLEAVEMRILLAPRVRLEHRDEQRILRGLEGRHPEERGRERDRVFALVRRDRAAALESTDPRRGPGLANALGAAGSARNATSARVAASNTVTSCGRGRPSKP